MNEQVARALRQALMLVGGSFVGTTALVIANKTGLVDQETTIRALMVLTGLLMVVTANGIPKSTTAKTARGQALQRQVGRAMVVAYLVWLAVWIFAPMNLATGLAIVPVLLAGSWVAVVCFRNRKTVV